MKKIIIDEEFKELLPELDAETQGSTAKRLANQYNVSRDTIMRGATTAVAIENGTYKNVRATRPTAAAMSEKPLDRMLAKIRNLHTVINKMSDDFSSELPKITENSERLELRAALRVTIDAQLELYNRLYA